VKEKTKTHANLVALIVRRRAAFAAHCWAEASGFLLLILLVIINLNFRSGFCIRPPPSAGRSIGRTVDGPDDVCGVRRIFDWLVVVFDCTTNIS